MSPNVHNFDPVSAASLQRWYDLSHARRHRARVRSLAAISHLFPIRTDPESTPARPVAYQVVKLELSDFGALELSPEASGQNHRDDFFENDADA